MEPTFGWSMQAVTQSLSTDRKSCTRGHLRVEHGSQSAIFRRDPVRFPGYDDGEGLNLELPLAQSAFSPLLSAAWLKIAVSIAPAAAMRSSLTLWV